MPQFHATDFEQIDALWRMLCHVPFEDFRPVACFLNGRPVYAIIRTPDDRQRSAPIPAPLAHKSPIP
jgi:hypothetical protein